MLARVEDSLLVVVDVQPSVLSLVSEKDVVVKRAKFMIECANLLQIPVVFTEQNSSKLGQTVDELRSFVTDPRNVIEKMTFSAWGSKEFVKSVDYHKRAQIVIVGIETHICVNQTAHDLMDEDLDVIVCADAVGARPGGMHEIGLKRMADEGAAIAHTESVVYEWLQTAEHAAFRDVLQVVKDS